MSAVAVARLSSVGELEAAGPIWRELQDGCTHQHVLMDHRWVLSWWRHFGAGKAQHTLLLTRGRTPVGIVPLAVTRGREQFPLREPYLSSPDDYRHLPYLKHRRFLVLRRLTFPLGLITGNVRGQAIFPADECDLYRAVARYAADTSVAWDIAVLPGLRPSAGEDGLLAEAARAAGLRTGTRRTNRPMLSIDLPANMADFLQACSGNFRKQLRKECSKLSRSFAGLGPMSVRCYRGRTTGEGMRLLFALETLSWKVGDDKDRRLRLRLDDQARAFFLEVAERFAADDQAQVLTLHFGETPAAAFFTLERGGVSVCVLTYRNEGLGAPVAVAPLWRELLQRSIDRGLRRIDVNGYTRNSLKWATDAEGYVQLQLFHSRPYSRLLHALDEGAVAARDWWSSLRGRAGRRSGSADEAGEAGAAAPAALGGAGPSGRSALFASAGVRP